MKNHFFKKRSRILSRLRCRLVICQTSDKSKTDDWTYNQSATKSLTLHAPARAVPKNGTAMRSCKKRKKRKKQKGPRQEQTWQPVLNSARTLPELHNVPAPPKQDPTPTPHRGPRPPKQFFQQKVLWGPPYQRLIKSAAGKKAFFWPFFKWIWSSHFREIWRGALQERVIILNFFGFFCLFRCIWRVGFFWSRLDCAPITISKIHRKKALFGPFWRLLGGLWRKTRSGEIDRENHFP